MIQIISLVLTVLLPLTEMSASQTTSPDLSEARDSTDASQGTLLYEADFSSLPATKLKLTRDWSVPDGLRLQSTNWWWETATLSVGTNDYQLDAVVDICSNGPGTGNGAGFVFRKSAAKSAVFYLSQNLAGYAALAELLGKPPEAKPEPAATPAKNTETNHAFQILPPQGRRFTPEELRGRKVGYKDSVYALSKDKEVGWHHLRAVVKGRLANFSVDNQLTCILDLTDYPEGEVGLYGLHQVVFKSFTVRALPPEVKVVSSRPMRKLLPENPIYPAQHSWTSAVAKAGAVLDQAIAEGTDGVPGDERMPAYTYRCVTWMKAGVKPFYAYPAFHHALFIKALINYSQFTGNDKYMKEAVRLGEWNLRHSTPETFKLPNLPYSTTYNGKMGGNVDGDTVMLDKVGAMGLTYIDLWQLEKAEMFKTGAIRIAETLLPLQLADGRWQNRVEPATGKVVQDYTSSQVFNIELMERLHAITGNPRYAESSRRALRWLLDHPVQTYRWTGYYEDVAADTESIGNWDAIDTARYLARHRQDNPQYLKLATDIFEWVATSFAVAQDGRWPLICEQSVCMPVMSGHTFHFAQLALELHGATVKQYYRDVARSAANAAFEFSHGSGDDGWYSLLTTPLSLGLEIEQHLK